MSVVWNPNLLAVAGVMMTMAGLALFAKAILVEPAATTNDAIRRAMAQRRVDLGFALPLAMSGLLAIGSAQLVSVGPTPFIVVLLLVLAFTLLLYAMLEATLVDVMVADAAYQPSQSKLALIAPPQAATPAATPHLAAEPGPSPAMGAGA